MRTLTTVSVIVFLLAGWSAGLRGAEREGEVAQAPPSDELVFDFGHVGIDFVVQHMYFLVNRTDRPLRVLKAVPSCQCTSVQSLDSLVEPGDSAFLRVKFDSKDLYGPVSKSFTVTTDHPDLPEVEFYIRSIVGQWFEMLKPEPISLFFLPTHRSKKLTVRNGKFPEIELSSMEQSDSTFRVTPIAKRAREGENLELEVSPREELQAGTYLSSLTLTIDKKDNGDPTILTIPIKTVRY